MKGVFVRGPRADQEGVRHRDRTTNPWSDMVGTDVIWVAGSNVAECSPITTNYIWQAREQGAKIFVLIVVVLQLWLLTTTMNAWLGGDDSNVWPAAANAPKQESALREFLHA